jgi:hypothetical protein
VKESDQIVVEIQQPWIIWRGWNLYLYHVICRTQEKNVGGFQFKKT